MAMIAGSVTVTAGVATGTGLSKEIYDAIAAGITFSGTPADQSGKANIATMANAIGQAVVAHIVAHAAVSTTVTGTAAAPIAVAVVPATGLGATTAPGTVTGSGTGTVA